MPGSDDEIARLQRIREQQLAARDASAPRSKRYQRTYQRQRTSRKGITWQGVVHTFSNKILGGIVGIVLGIAAWIVLSLTLDVAWVDWAGLGAVGLLGGFGVLVGASFDWRDDLRDF